MIFSVYRSLLSTERTVRKYKDISFFVIDIPRVSFNVNFVEKNFKTDFTEKRRQTEDLFQKHTETVLERNFGMESSYLLGESGNLLNSHI